MCKQDKMASAHVNDPIQGVATASYVLIMHPYI